MSYTDAFFRARASGSRSSADQIVSICTKRLHPQSVIDIGCGTGEWLAVFAEQGVSTVTGYDGEYVDRDLLAIPADSFHGVDLVEWLEREGREGRYDLAVSLEVAEHLPERVGDRLVARLTELAPAVLFSAAIPLQGGTGHINEQWQSYWAELFRRRGLYPHDVIRAKVWNDPLVDPWYAQNALLYLPEPAEAAILDIVHPQLYVKHLRNATVRGRAEVMARRAFWGTVRAARILRNGRH
jgi:SAM-dependent methyltransferase